MKVHTFRYFSTSIFIAVLVGVFLLYKASTGTPKEDAFNEVNSQPTVTNPFEFTEKEKVGDIVEKKAYVLKVSASNEPFSAADRSEIGAIMLVKSQLYSFSDIERDMILKKLNQ